MRKKTIHPFPWKLSIFPCLELVFFIAAILANNPFLSFFFIVVAGVLLSFGIHIFFHECVHVRSKFPQAVNIIQTLFLGLPFDGYRVHHFNHHTYANDLKDFSSTWYTENGEKVGYKVCRYTFGWLRQLATAIYAPDPFDKTLGDVDAIKSRIPPQKLAILIFCIALALISLKALLLYLALVYFGWAFSALHNYGQHPPIEEELVYTYANKTYNFCFFNNGLHWEHHDKPWLSWSQIELDKKSPRIDHAHLINPCLTRGNK